MKTTQRTALPLFIERGFDNVSVTEIAEAAGMAASTIYRHFGTKEHIVLWDEHDAAIDAALTNALSTQTPWSALRSVFVDEFSTRYDNDLDFQLLRVRYIYATEALHGAAIEDDLRNRAELGAGLAQVLSAENRDAAELLAGAALLAIDHAIERWQASPKPASLADLLRTTFDQLGHLDQLR